MTLVPWYPPWSTQGAAASDAEVAAAVAASVVAAQGLPKGLTGATQAARFAGATVSGAPASGTFAVGDFVVDQTGTMWVCTVAGTPGTWVDPASRVLNYAEVTSGTVDVTSTSATDITGLSVTFTVPSSGAFWLELHIPALTAFAGQPTASAYYITDPSNAAVAASFKEITGSLSSDGMLLRKRMTGQSGAKTYKARMLVGSGDTVRLATNSGQTPYYLLAEKA